MKFSIDIYNPSTDLTITLRNLTFEMLNEFADEGNIDEILGTKWYMFGMYEKLEILGYKFMMMKNSKKAVVLLGIG